MGAPKSAIRKRRSVMSKSEAHSYLLNLASRLKVDLGESDIEATKKILSKGKPLSAIVGEM